MSSLRRATRPTKRAGVGPLTRISPHFILADFLGNHSVFSRGLVNVMDEDAATAIKLQNLTALCHEGLEPVMEKWGPMSISYGYISPDLSRALVKYQDPDKPSHHRFDLGAAADICVHEWVQDEFVTLEDLFLPDSVRSAPIALAHGIDQMDIPYSRIITYSESPFLCLAVSGAEVERRQPRKAFYENRYQGRKGDKPEYIQLSSQATRNRHFQQLQEQGLEHPWRGEGYPTYHGGGFRQYHHMRVSRYTMVSDFLINLQSIANGAKNVPAFNLDSVQDAFAAAGLAYDWLVKELRIKRATILDAYTSHLSPYFDPENDWRDDTITFSLVLPEYVSAATLVFVPGHTPPGLEVSWPEEGKLLVTVDKEVALTHDEW